MSLSPARQHRLRVQAEQAAREGGSVRHASGYDLMLLQLAEDRRRLKGVQSTVKKAEIKVELLPKYAAWAEGVLAGGGAQQDDVLMYVMLWRIDAGDYAGALEIGRHALRHGWVMPLGNRNVQTVLAEEMADAAQSAMLAATGFDADLLLQTLELTDGLDMPDQSRARLHKAIGAVLSESNPAYRKAAALGSTFLTLGAAPEVAASAANAMVRELSIATMQSKSFFEGMNLLKLNPEVIEKQMTKDAMGTIQRVLEKVNALPQDKRLSAMTMLFGKEFGDDAAKLANNLPELQRQLKLTAGNDALGSMQKESDINKDSLSAQWLLVKTGAQNTFSSLGETLRQPLMDILYTVKSVTGALRRWVEANPELTGTLMKASAVVAAVTVGLGTLAVALAAVLGPLAVIRLGFSVLGIKTLSSVTAAVTRTSSALSWLAGAPLALLRRGLASSGNAAGLLTAPLSSLRRTASLTGNVLKTVAGAPVALLRSGLSGLRAVAVMFMNPLAVLRGGLAAAGTVLRVLASGPLAMLRVALYAISGLLGALLSPIGLVVTALAGVALVVWKYWQPITAFLAGVVEGFKAAAGPISAAFEPLKPVFQWIGDKVQALWGWFTDLLTPVKSTSAELQSAAAMGRRFGEALAEGLNMVMHPLDSLKSGVSWLLEKLGIVSKEAAKAKLPESVTRQQPATVNADGKVMMPSGGFPSWGYGFAGMYDSGGYIPRGQFGIVGENGPEIVNGPANVTSRRNTAALAAVVAGMMGVAAAPAELPPLHPLALPAKGGEAMVSRAATVPPVQRIEAPMQIIIQTQPGQSAQDIAREVARQLDERERRLKAKARSNYSDQGGYDA